ncbi:MAG: molybdate ABC transporter substrate-binding protein [Lachnospiraceae bacterium]|nr:molybdate ABC transporter substrate-binding protein [Lachnospiraceae bacterium]
MGLFTGCGAAGNAGQAGSAQSGENAGGAQSEAAQSTQADSAGTSSEAAASSEAASQAADNAGEGEIVVFAAASMTETLTEIKSIYESAHPGVTITYNFDSSGTLKTQIQEGADCDLFISAGQKQMNQLDINADASVNTEGLDFVAADSRINLLENKVTLCVPDSNPKNIQSFDDLNKAFQDGNILFCMGNSDVPVGQYTQKILTFYGLDEESLAKAGKITYGTNVKEVTTQISEASVDAGVIYCTDAYSAGLKVVDSATKEMCGQVIYPASVLKTAKNAEAAQYFLDYLTTDEAMAVFEKVGFSPVK